MIHYSCDRCGRPINPRIHVRYVVRIEVEADIHPLEDQELDDDRDYLNEIDSLLTEQAGETPADLASDRPRRSFDLCEECCRKFMQNPLGCDAPSAVGFGSN
jgi:hypothetical protein